MERKVEIDIFKAILIILVVVGHSLSHETQVNKYIYLFHMPAFFLLSGYLTDFGKEDFIQFVRKKFFSYVVPYIAYSIMFYIFFIPEPFIKNLLRTCFGGVYNITLYSFPYWYINCLFLSIVFLKLIKMYISKYLQIVILFLLWISIHVISGYEINLVLPWGILNCLGALCYISLGDYAKKINLPVKGALFLVFIVVVVEFVFNWNYHLNMMQNTYSNLVLDVFIPLIFSLGLYQLCCYVLLCGKCVVVPLQYLGKACMSIYFTHAAFIYLFTNIFNIHIFFSIIFSVIGGFLWHLFVIENRVTRFIFLGILK